jgi:hypothetical protein
MINKLNLALALALASAATQLAELEKVNAEVWSNLEFRKSVRAILENANEIVQVLQSHAELLEANRWRDVNEESPEPNTRVLTWDGRFFDKAFYGEFQEPGKPETAKFIYNGCHWLTHWRPLPAPPKENDGRSS